MSTVCCTPSGQRTPIRATPSAGNPGSSAITVAHLSTSVTKLPKDISPSRPTKAARSGASAARAKIASTMLSDNAFTDRVD